MVGQAAQQWLFVLVKNEQGSDQAIQEGGRGLLFGAQHKLR